MLRLLVRVALLVWILPALQAQPEMPWQAEDTSFPSQRSMGQVLLTMPSQPRFVVVPAVIAELQQEEDWFHNQAPRALALLTAVSRENPSNHRVAERLMAALSQRNFPRLLEVTNTPAQPAASGKPWTSPDGAREFRRFEDRSGRLYDTRTGEPLGPLLKHASGINGAWFSPDGLRLATISNPDESARIWDATTGAPLSPLLKHQSYVNSARFSPDGLRLVTGSCDSTARVWDGFTGAPRTEPMKVGYGIVISAEFSPDGRRVLATSSERAGPGSSPRLCYVFDVLPGQGLAEQGQSTGNPQGGQVEDRTRNQTMPVWDVRTRRFLGQSDLSHPVVLAPTNWDAAYRRALAEARLGAADFTAESTELIPDGRPRSARGVSRFQADQTVSVPAWLPELAEAVAGMRMNEKMVPKNVPWADRLNIQRQLTEAPATNSCERWAKWFPADRSTRTVSAFSAVTVPEYVQRRIEENTLTSLREAAHLSPTNGLAFARLAKQVLTQSDKDNPRRVGEADFFSRYALKWSPNDAEVAKIRAEIEGQIKNLPKP